MLETARTLIVDEIHAVVGDKRGSHLALSIERLEQLVRQHSEGNRQFVNLVRIGLSATQRPIEEVARFLVGTKISTTTRRIAPSSTAVTQENSTSRSNCLSRLCRP